MSTLRTDNLQTTDSSFTIAVSDLSDVSTNNQFITNLQGTGAGKGANLVGALDYSNNPTTVQAILTGIGATSTLVSSVAAVRLLSASFLGVAETVSYYAGIAGGSGRYRPDLTDTTSVDDGFLVLVSTGGVRRKLIYTDKVTVKQAGARGDYVKLSNTGTDDGARLQLCHTNTPRGVTIYYPLGLYLTSTTISMNGGSSVEFQSRATSTDEAKCAIVGASALDGVVKTQAGDTTFSTKIVNMVVTRQTGTWASSARGLIVSGVDQQVFEDCASFRHGIAVHVNGQLNPTFSRLNTWMVSGVHLKISECVEPRFNNCRFGRNGGVDLASDAYVLIDGSTGIQVDTVDFTACQFNQSGSVTNSVLRVTNYNNPNGIITFTGCHMEGWGTYVVNIDATTPRLQRVKFNGCTITSGTAAQFAGGTLSSVEDWQLVGCTIAATLTFQNAISTSMVGGQLSGNLVIDGGKTIITGVRITGNATFVGATGKLTFTNNQVGGTVSDSFTGSKIVINNI